MEATYQQLADRVCGLWSQNSAAGQKRTIILLAGPPGSGKSTIASKVTDIINTSKSSPSVVALSADGFHLPLSTLNELPNAKESLARRGAPWTFDGRGVVNLVSQLRSSAGKYDVEAPTFDHATKDPVADAIRIPSDTQVCIVDGNYVLTDQAPWNELSVMADDRWLITVDPMLALHRVAARHLEAGIADTMKDALSRAKNNDVINGEYVVRHSAGRFDVQIESLDETNSK